VPMRCAIYPSQPAYQTSVLTSNPVLLTINKILRQDASLQHYLIQKIRILVLITLLTLSGRPCLEKSTQPGRQGDFKSPQSH
jgi:hypothetical protein